MQTLSRTVTTNSFNSYDDDDLVEDGEAKETLEALAGLYGANSFHGAE